MGNKAAIALFGMSGILILFATYTSLLPDIIESKAQIEINSSKSELIDYLSKAKDWEEWLFTEDIKKTEGWSTMTSGKSFGEGSVLKWFSESIGDGALEIKKIDSTQIIFERISDNNSFRDRCYLFLEDLENGTLLRMVDSLDIATNFFARYEAQDESYIQDIDLSNLEVLRRLKTILENK
tara:strand:- start:5668 stop:6210 length:543 start_codon:yes stop_codon:yes gene_type:complete